MSKALSAKIRYYIDQAFPFFTRMDYPHKGSDVLFPLSSVEYGAMVSSGSLFTLNVDRGIIRDLNGNIVEVTAQAAVTGGATFAAPASGKSLFVSIYWDTAAKAVVAHNGGTANVGSSSPEPDPANQTVYTGTPEASMPGANPTASTLVLLAVAEMRNGDTTFTRIDNTARRQN
jgi:hypothetical protein